MIKLLSILIMVAMFTASISTVCFAGTEIKPDGITITYPDSTNELSNKAGKILGTIRNISAILAAVLVAVLGVKFMLGSTEEKAEYKKSFMPLIIGIVVVLSATTIAKFIWDMAA